MMDKPRLGEFDFDEWLRVEREHERSLVGFPAISRRFGVPRSVLVTVGR